MADNEIENRAITPSVRTIEDIQNDFASNCGFRREVIWDLLSAEQADILKNKIKELIPDQDKGQNAINDLRETLFENVWAQRKYTNRNSLSTIIYVLVTNETDLLTAKNSTQFSCHPVFRTRKCVDESDSSSCCMIFIDEIGRVYQNWKSYVSDNVLPKGTMVAPSHGIYMFDKDGIVELEAYATPSSSVGQQVLNVADTTSAVGGFMAALVPIAALCSLPVAAPVMAIAAGVGLTAAGYSAIRSGSTLVDRQQHDQSIGLADRQARNSWLGVVGGVIGVGAVGATRLMTTAAAAGREVSVVTELVVNGMNISSIVLSGTGVANGAIDMILKYNDGDEITALDIVQLSASLVLFTHSVSNFRLASNIISDTRNSTIKSYRESLSNRQRRMFDKMSKETIRIRGESRGKLDIIRSVNEIPSKQYLNDMFKINKELNKQNIRPAFGAAAGEGIVLNNEVAVDSQGLRNNVQHNVGPDILGQVTQPIPQSHHESGQSVRPMQQGVRLLHGNISDEPASFDFRSNMLSAGVRALSLSTILFSNNVQVALSEFGDRLFENIVNAESFENVILVMAENFTVAAFSYLMRLVTTFIELILDDLHTVLRTFISSECILYRMITHVLDTYTEKSFEFLNEKSLEILESLRKYFLSLNPNNFKDLLKKCEHCIGYYAICGL